MKKTEEFCRKSDSKAAMIAFSKAGNCYVLAHPHIDIVLGCYEAESSSGDEEEVPPMTELQKRIAMAIESGRWDEAVRGLGSQELDQLFAEVENVRRMAREGKNAAAESTSSRSGGTGNN